MPWQRWAGIQKCYPFEESRLAKWSPPYICQPKYDGDRCSNTANDNYPLLLTSEENPYFSIPHIKQQMIDTKLYTLPLDGEVYNHDLFLEGGHELIHGIASRTVNLHPRHKEIDFVVFDLKDPSMPQMERLLKLISISKSFPKNIKLAPYWICDTLDDIKRVYDNLIKMHYEGVVIRHALGPYEERRSTWIMKHKPKKKDTYKIVGWKEEISKDGIPKGRIGSLVMSSQAGDTFNVSAGLNDENRAYLWGIRGIIAGNIAIVHYQHLTNKKIPKGCFDLKIPELGV